jgi:sugar phosphate permease
MLFILAAVIFHCEYPAGYSLINSIGLIIFGLLFHHPVMLFDVQVLDLVSKKAQVLHMVEQVCSEINNFFIKAFYTLI